MEEKKDRLLLHVCCAPCSSHVLEYLENKYDITLLFYNPNITEQDEYQKRIDELYRFISEAPFAKNVRNFSRLQRDLRKSLRGEKDVTNATNSAFGKQQSLPDKTDTIYLQQHYQSVRTRTQNGSMRLDKDFRKNYI